MTALRVIERGTGKPATIVFVRPDSDNLRGIVEVRYLHNGRRTTMLLDDFRQRFTHDQQQLNDIAADTLRELLASTKGG